MRVASPRSKRVGMTILELLLALILLAIVFGKAYVIMKGANDSLGRETREVVLEDLSTYGTFVNNVKVAGETELAVGQTIRVGTPGEEFQVITCLENDETTVT